MFQLYRGVVEHKNVSQLQLVQAEIYDRRGKEVTFLSAEYASDSFRKLHSEEVADEDLGPGTIRVRSSCYSSNDKPSSFSNATNALWIFQQGFLADYSGRKDLSVLSVELMRLSLQFWPRNCSVPSIQWYRCPCLSKCHPA